VNNYYVVVIRETTASEVVQFNRGDKAISKSKFFQKTMFLKGLFWVNFDFTYLLGKAQVLSSKPTNT